MPKYHFKARSNTGELVEGLRIVSSDRELISKLQQEGLVVFSISETRADAPAKSRGSSVGGSIKTADIAIFCRQMSTMVNAGVSILEVLEDLSEMVTRARMQKIIKTIVSDVRAGTNLSDAMKKHPEVFDRVFVAMVSAGEKSGKLAKILHDLANYMEAVVKLRLKVRAASAYPMFVFGFFMVSFIGIVTLLIPKFKTMFASFGVALPLPTRVVVSLSDFVLAHIIIIIIAAGALIAALTMFRRTAAGHQLIDRLLLRMPIAGTVVIKIILARFFQTLTTLVRSGTDIVASLDIAARVSNNVIIEKMVVDMKNRVIEGSMLSVEMDRMDFIPKMVVRMTRVGEKSGQLDDMFEKISMYYSDEVDAFIASMSAVIEPVLIVGLGIMVGAMVVVMYLPMFKMALAVMGGS